MTTTLIQRWGDSLAICIPSEMANRLGLIVGGNVELLRSHGNLIIRPIHRRSRYKLADLLKTCKTKPHADHWPVPMGDEII